MNNNITNNANALRKKDIYIINSDDIITKTNSGAYIKVPKFLFLKEIEGEIDEQYYIINDDSHLIHQYCDFYDEWDEEIIDIDDLEEIEELGDFEDIHFALLKKQGTIFVKDEDYITEEDYSTSYVIGKITVGKNIHFFSTDGIEGIFNPKNGDWILPLNEDYKYEKVLDCDAFSGVFHGEKIRTSKVWMNKMLSKEVLINTYNISTDRGIEKMPNKGILKSLKNKFVSSTYLKYVDDAKNNLLCNESPEIQRLLVMGGIEDIKYCLKHRNEADINVIFSKLMEVKDSPEFSYHLRYEELDSLYESENTVNFEIYQKFTGEKEIEDYLFISPKTYKEVVEEGVVMHNCLKTNYEEALRHEETNIFFMRRKSQPEKPLVDIEIDNLGNEAQAYQSYNREVTASQREVINKWKKTIKRNF